MTNDISAAGLAIGEAARAARLSAKTIRYYEDIGLIPKPQRRRAGAAGTRSDRIYSQADIGRLRFVREARQVGLALDDVRELLKISHAGCPSTQPAYAELLRRHVHSIDERINHLLGLRSAVRQLLSRGSTAGVACCTWESCGCMHAETSPKGSEARVS